MCLKDSAHHHLHTPAELDVARGSSNHSEQICVHRLLPHRLEDTLCGKKEKEGIEQHNKN